MEKLGGMHIVINNQFIIAGYGKQFKGDDASRPRRLKFTTFESNGISNYEIHYISN